MKCDALTRSTGLLSLGRGFNKVWIVERRDTMASGGRLLGLQLPPVPSHISDFMPSCVRSSHSSDAKECCSLASAGPSSSGLSPLFGGSGDISSLGESKAIEGYLLFSLSNAKDGDVDEKQAEKPAEKCARKEKADAVVTYSSPPGAETPAEEDVSGTTGNETAQNSHSQPGRGLRSKLTSMLSLEKRPSLGGLHSNQLMMEMAGFQSSSFTRRASIPDSKICAAIQKESFARVFDLYDDARCYGTPGGYVTRSAEHGGDTGLKADLSWMEDKSNDSWGTEPWHYDQRSILMKTLHIMRCDIESLKMMLRSLDLPAVKSGLLDPNLHEAPSYKPYMHPVMMRSISAMSELKQTSGRASNEEQTENRVDFVKEEEELAETVETERSSDVDKELCVCEVSPTEGKEEIENSISMWSRGCPKKRKQWWRELLAAFGLTVWVITGAVLVAKAIGVPNLGVGNNVAYNGFWGRSDDEETKPPVQGATGVVELGAYTFYDTVKKRPTFVMFYAPWCPHCQRLHPIWTQLAGVMSKKGYNVQLAIVDATKHSRLADKYEVPGFPTLIMFKDGKPVGRHRGARDIDTLLSFVERNK